MRFNSETANHARLRKAGLGAARYWRERGFANLVLARAVAKANREQRKLGILPADSGAAYDDAAGNPDQAINPDAPIVPKPVE